MKKEEIMSAYIAGIMDGDGSFSLIKKKPAKAHRSPEYNPLIQFGSNELDSVKRLADLFGGSIFTSKASIDEDGVKRREFYRWRLHGKLACKKFIEKIVPYLAIKKDRAELINSFIDKFPFKRGSNLQTSEMIAEKESWYWKIRQKNEELNHTTVGRKTAHWSKDPLFLAYMAGLMDTDGSFSIKKEKATGGSVNPKYSIIILLSMQDIRALNKIRAGSPIGNVIVIQSPHTKRGFSYRLMISKLTEAKELVQLLLPYMQTKRDQCKIIEEFCAGYELINYRNPSDAKVQYSFREECYQKLCCKNKYGVYKPTLIDLEAQEGDRAEGESHRERLSEMA